jgi:hypothetical protein
MRLPSSSYSYVYVPSLTIRLYGPASGMKRCQEPITDSVPDTFFAQMVLKLLLRQNRSTKSCSGTPSSFLPISPTASCNDFTLSRSPTALTRAHNRNRDLLIRLRSQCHSPHRLPIHCRRPAPLAAGAAGGKMSCVPFEFPFEFSGIGDAEIEGHDLVFAPGPVGGNATGGFGKMGKSYGFPGMKRCQEPITDSVPDTFFAPQPTARPNTRAPQFRLYFTIILHQRPQPNLL